MSSTGDAFGDACDDAYSGRCRFENGVCRECRRYVDHRGIGAGLAYRVLHGVEYGSPEMYFSASSRGDAAHEIRSVLDRLFGVERSLPAGESLANDPRAPVDQYASWRVALETKWVSECG